MHFEEGEQLSQQPVARKLEGGDGTLETLEEVRADQPDDLLLTILLEGVDVFVRSLIPVQRVVHGQSEQRVLAGKRLLEHVEQSPIGLADRVLSHLWRFSVREVGGICLSRGSGSRARRHGCAGRRGDENIGSLESISCASAMCSNRSAWSEPTRSRSPFSI